MDAVLASRTRKLSGVDAHRLDAARWLVVRDTNLQYYLNVELCDVSRLAGRVRDLQISSFDVTLTALRLLYVGACLRVFRWCGFFSNFFFACVFLRT